MTLTTTTPSSGPTRRALLAQITTLTTDASRGRRIRALLRELDDIDADRELALRCIESGTWLSDLRVEERDVWDHLAEALST